MSISLHSTNITVKKKNIVMKKLYAALIIMVSYTVTISCVGQGGYLFDVINNTENMVVLYTRPLPNIYGIPSINNFELKSDTTSPMQYYTDKIDTVFMIPPHNRFHVGAFKELYWNSDDVSPNPETNGVTPLWKLIKSIQIEDEMYPSQYWSEENVWKLKNIYDETYEYSLTINRF